jgi:hypothetical protein
MISVDNELKTIKSTYTEIMSSDHRKKCEKYTAICRDFLKMENVSPPIIQEIGMVGHNQVFQSFKK